MPSDTDQDKANRQLPLFGLDLCSRSAVVQSNVVNPQLPTRSGLYLASCSSPSQTKASPEVRDGLTAIEARIIERTKLF